MLFAAAVILMAGCGKDEPVGPDGNGTVVDTIPPAKVGDLTVRTIGTNSISLMWSAPGDDAATGRADAYDLRYHTEFISDVNWEEAEPVNNVPSPKEAGLFEIFTVSGLACSTQYYFALKTKDEVPNVSALSNCPNGITRQEHTPPLAVNDLTATALSDTEFLLTWTAPGDDGLAGTASEYDIRYSRFYIDSGDWATATPAVGEPNPKPGGETDSFVVSGLDPGTNYYFAMKTADEVPNVSEISNCCSAMAYGELLMLAPESFTIGNVDHLTITFRAQVGVRIRIRVWGHQPYYNFNLFQVVTNDYYSEGVHTILWDFWSDEYEMYIDEDRYEVELMYGDVTVTSKFFRAINP